MTCEDCGKELRIGLWPFCAGSGIHGRPYGRQGGAVHPSERAVVYRHPKTGHTIYPPTNNEPMTPQQRSWGYERVELPSLRAIEKLEKEENVQSEVAWFDKGTLRGHDDTTAHDKPIDLTGLEFGTIE